MKNKFTPLYLLISLVFLPIFAEDAVKTDLTEAEWKEKLTPEQYKVLRKEGTERAFSSELNDEKREGTFNCAGCGEALFASGTKYKSGTGWPSFYQPIRPEAVGTKKDRTFLSVRTEVHCANCGGHLGHVFEDGPEPTGLRYCMNGVAMKFVPAEKE
ncbi:peptide-methionine (R)-S-oxide reductase MsrB [Kiritimatiellaeota bacterium B1221]|nr:peptide-methionine (R)-S-oxide reductase MsrB [Kiritimatiellaeota bacterium B1221]